MYIVLLVVIESESNVMEAKKVERLRKQYVSKRRKAKSLAARKRWSFESSVMAETTPPETSVLPGSPSKVTISDTRELDSCGDFSPSTPSMVRSRSSPKVSLPCYKDNSTQTDSYHHESDYLSSGYLRAGVAITSSPIANVGDESFDSIHSPVSSLNSTLYVPGFSERLEPVSLEKVLFLGESTKITDFVEQINATSSCKEGGCTGKLVPYEVRSVGLGGAVEIKYVCDGCWVRKVSFSSSEYHVVPRQGHQLTTTRPIASLALQVAHFVFGSSYRQYYKTVKLALGMPAVGAESFYTVVRLIYKHVEDMLQEQCNEAKAEMKALNSEEIGSFKRAVTAGDGTWLQRKFSKNHTFTLRNYLNNALLYYIHLCMKGSDNDITPGELYPGTSKAAEGHAAQRIFEQAKRDDVHIEVHWQDGDSSTANAFRMYYPDEQRSKILLCGGHIARAFEKNLKEFKSKKSFGDGFVKLHKSNFPEVGEVSCHCKNRHKSGCGCLSDPFIKQARVNLYCCLLQAGKSPEAFATGMRHLGKYHSKDIHEWDGGRCVFHQPKKCTCKKCTDEIMCEGREYHTRNPLKCPMHALAFEIECERRACQAPDVIHPELGKGSTNIVEASHHVLTKFRSKDQNLQRLHYIASTNLGLLQANMTYMFNKRGPQYHWILDLYRRLGLPIFYNMDEYLKLENEKRMQALLNQKSAEAKQKRIRYKAKRSSDLDKRKQWVKQQAIQHTYGSDEDGEDDDSCTGGESKSSDSENVLNSLTKMCKCGSTTHLRTTHSQCPLNKSSTKQDCFDSDFGEFFSESDNDEDDNEGCTCGAIDAGRRAHHWSCPLNARNIGKSSDEVTNKEIPGRQDGDQVSNKGIPSLESRQDELDITFSSSVEGYRVGNCSDNESYSFVENPTAEYCICRGKEKETMIACDDPNCPVEWFHFECVGLSKAPKGKWFCRDCASRQKIQPTSNPRKRKVVSTSSSLKYTRTDSEAIVCPCGVNVRAHKRSCPLNPSQRRRDNQVNSIDDSDVEVTGKSETNPVLVSGPLPSQEWRTAAVEVLKKWSTCGINVVTNPTIRKVRCTEIAPHVRDRVLADGHCLFRTLSKEITGTEENHRAVRLALVNFMRHKDIAPQFANYMFPEDVNHSSVEIMEQYVKKSNMHLAAWGTDKEIHSAATLLQVEICIFSSFGANGRQWLKFKPIFSNENCLAPSNFKIYIYHTTSGDHYDRVCPCLC